MAILVINGLSVIFARTSFMIGAFSGPIANPEEVFDAFDIRYYTNALATVLHLGPDFFVMVIGSLQRMRGVRKKQIKFHRISGRNLSYAAQSVPSLASMILKQAFPLSL